MLPAILTEDALAKLLNVKKTPNVVAVHKGLIERDSVLDMGQPPRLVHYLAQLSHESGNFRYDRELWGPTPAQKRYDSRAVLGHSASIPGEGYKFRGRSGIQVTGRANYRAFTVWVKQNIDPTAPDFEENPDLLLTDPWEGIAPLWYWEVKKLNRYSDRGDMHGQTYVINGGFNGLADRLDRYERIGLKVLGYGFTRSERKRFQSDSHIAVDGLMGPQSRGAIHRALSKLDKTSFTAEPKEGFFSCK